MMQISSWESNSQSGVQEIDTFYKMCVYYIGHRGSPQPTPVDRLTLGSSPYGPDAPRPYRRALIPAQESPVALLKFQMAPILKILISSGSKKGTQIYFFFSLKKSRQTNPLQVPLTHPISCGS
jgi:hypothetical protein